MLFSFAQITLAQVLGCAHTFRTFHRLQKITYAVQFINMPFTECPPPTITRCEKLFFPLCFCRSSLNSFSNNYTEPLPMAMYSAGSYYSICCCFWSCRCLLFFFSFSFRLNWQNIKVIRSRVINHCALGRYSSHTLKGLDGRLCVVVWVQNIVFPHHDHTVAQEVALFNSMMMSRWMIFVLNGFSTHHHVCVSYTVCVVLHLCEQCECTISFQIFIGSTTATMIHLSNLHTFIPRHQPPSHHRSNR